MSRAKAAVDEFFSKQEVVNMIAMLDAASKGDEAKVQRLLSRGVSASCCDYVSTPYLSISISL